jgi:phosphate transport system ATP-binding protein
MNDTIAGARVEGDRLDGRTSTGGMDVVQLRPRSAWCSRSRTRSQIIYENVAYGRASTAWRAARRLDAIVEKSLKRAGLWEEVKTA